MRLAPFGVFVEILPGIEGLAHISELSWTKRVTKPEEIVHVGDTVAVKIKDINSESRRISLSLREAEGDPWQDAAQRFAAGSLVQGTVDGRSPHGLFIALAPGITGLLPAGVIKNAKNSGQYSKLDKGDSVTLIVQNLDTAARRISLAPEGTDAAATVDDKAWKQHANLGRATENTGINTLAQALHKAMQNK